MSEFKTVLPSGMRVRQIQTQTVPDPKTGKATVVPVLDAQGNEIELYAVHVPQILEACDGTVAERQVIIDGFVADIQAKGQDIALVRANARMTKQDPNAAEAAHLAAQAAAVAPTPPIAPATPN